MEQANIAATQSSATKVKPNPPGPKRRNIRNVNAEGSNDDVRSQKTA